MKYTNLWEDLEHKDKRIAELEAELASRNDVLNKDGVRRLSEVQVAYEQERNRLNVAQHTDRIKELEAELATRETNQSAQRGQLYLQIDDLKADNARLRKCLKRIADLTVEGKSAIEYVISGIAQEGLE